MTTAWRGLPQPKTNFNSGWGSQLVTRLQSIFTDIFEADFETKAKLILRGGLVGHVTRVDSTPYLIKLTDHTVDVNVAVPVALTLPQNAMTGQEIIVQDSSGAAGVNNITTSAGGGDSLNGVGAGSLVLSTNYGRRVFRYNGLQWIGS